MPHKDPETAKAWRREWWRRSPEMRVKQNARTREMRTKINEMLRLHKVTAGCADCGFNAHHSALEFHHVGDDKELNLSFAKSIAQAEREMAKCEVLCSNCHRIRHWEERHPCKPDIFEATYERSRLQPAAAAESPSRLEGVSNTDYVMVPREPTSEMHEAAFKQSLSAAEGDEMNGHFVEINAKIYRAMLSAAPKFNGGRDE